MNKNIYMITNQDKIAGAFSIRNIDTENWISNVKVDYLYLVRIAILPEYQGKNT